jgi:chromosome segregation ATPase
MHSQLTSLLDAMKNVNAKLEKQDATIEELQVKNKTQDEVIEGLKAKNEAQDEVIEGLEAKNETQNGAIKTFHVDLHAEKEARKEDIQSLIQAHLHFLHLMRLPLIHSWHAHR